MLRHNHPKAVTYLPPLTLFLIHLIVAIYYKHVAGVTIQAGIYPGVTYTWDDFWQTIPLDLLRHNLWESIWSLHAQPPFYNLYGAFFANVCYPNHLECLHYSNIILGATLPVLIYVILLYLIQNGCIQNFRNSDKPGGGRFAYGELPPAPPSPPKISDTPIQNRVISFLAALIFALHPSLFLYEAFMIYTFLTSFLVTLSVSFLVWFQSTNRTIHLYLFILCLNLLILTRGIYHPLILLLAVSLVMFLATPDAIETCCVLRDNKRSTQHATRGHGKTLLGQFYNNQWGKTLIISLLISLLSLGWYGKNYVQYGFFGSSSWAGLNLWRIATHDYSESELKDLAGEGVLDDMVVNVEVFSPLENYEDYGFIRQSNIALLAQPSLNNINIVAISNHYLTNALTLIRLDPRRYLIGVKDAYRVYACHSSARHFFVKENATKIATHVAAGEAITGFWLGDDPIFTMSICSLFYLLLPASLLAYALLFIKKCGLKPQKGWKACLRAEAVMLYIAFMLIYTTLISSLFEIGENERFKFLIEPVFWIFLVALVWRVLQRLFKVFHRSA